MNANQRRAHLPSRFFQMHHAAMRRQARRDERVANIEQAIRRNRSEDRAYPRALLADYDAAYALSQEAFRFEQRAWLAMALAGDHWTNGPRRGPLMIDATAASQLFGAA